MNHTKLPLALLLAITLASSAPAANQPPTTAPAAETYSLNLMFEGRITYESNFQSLSWLSARLEGIRNLEGLKDIDIKSMGRASDRENGIATEKIRLTVKPAALAQSDDPRKTAEEILAAARQQFEAAVATLQKNMSQDYDEFLTAARTHLAEQQKLAADTDAAIQKAEDDVKDINLRFAREDLSPANIDQVYQDILDQKRRLEIDLPVKQARAAAIQKTVAKIREEAKNSIATDAIVQELQKIVEGRTAQLETTSQMVKKGLATPADLTQAQTALAEAKVRLLERQEALTQVTGGDALNRLNGELLTLAIDMVELQARIDLVTTRRDKIASMVPLALSLNTSRTDSLPRKIAVLRQHKKETQQSIAEDEKNLASPPPRVEVKDLKP